MTSAELLQKLAEQLDGFEVRSSQSKMLEACESILANKGVLLVEAPTGVGKTFAYSIPAILSEKKTIISTRTINLQSQLFEKDLPTLAKLHRFKFALCKGFSNYLCKLSLTGYQPKSMKELEERSRLLRWIDETETGDREELNPPSELWYDVGADSDGCVRKECEFYNDCFYFQAREHWFRSEILVVNHSLLAADAALHMQSGKGLLPQAEALIVDEAHALEEAFSKAFTQRVSWGAIQSLLRQASALDRRLSLKITDILNGLENASRTFFEALSKTYTRSPFRVQKEFALRAETENVMQVLSILYEQLGKFVQENPLSLFTTLEQKAPVVQVRKLSAWVGRLWQTLAEFTDPQEGQKPKVRWVEQYKGGASLSVAPLYPKDEMQTGLLSRFESVILTSATLSVGGDFSYYQGQLGISGRALALDPVFDYSKQAKIFVHKVEPPSGGQFSPLYLEELAKRIYGIIEWSKGGVLVLFTNARVMETIHQALSAQLGATYLLLRQGQEPRQILLEKFKADGNALLFGLDSFWEGIDVPGQALRTVIITRLPFEVPDDPVHEARVEKIEQEGRNAFADYMLPRAALRLKQGFGRLIRSKQDVGEVHLLDGRLLSKSYGRRFLAALPKGIGVETID
jgi:ATP-dependent DNA helicase DinG